MVLPWKIHKQTSKKQKSTHITLKKIFTSTKKKKKKKLVYGVCCPAGIQFIPCSLWPQSRVCEHISGFGGLEVACWPLVPKFVGSHLAEAVGFLGRKNPQHAFLRREVKPSVPCRSFTACTRALNVTCNSAFRQNCRTFLAHSSTLRHWVLLRGDTCGDAWWRKLERLTTIAQ